MLEAGCKPEAPSLSALRYDSVKPGILSYARSAEPMAHGTERPTKHSHIASRLCKGRILRYGKIMYGDACVDMLGGALGVTQGDEVVFPICWK